MEIRDVGADRFVRLEPVGYEFPDVVGVEFDSDWLIIAGQARSDDGEWSFQEPSLLVEEALGFGSWMRDAANGRAPLLVADRYGRTWPTTEAIEPDLGFGVVRYGIHTVTVRAFLRLEATQRIPGGRTTTDMDFFIDVTASQESMTRAADEWDAALAAFPKRS